MSPKLPFFLGVLSVSLASLVMCGCAAHRGAAGMAASDAAAAAGDSCEEIGATGAREITYLSGNTFRARPIIYSAYEGKAIVEGDIVIGTVEQARLAKARVEKARRPGFEPLGIGITGASKRWPDKTVYYTTDPKLKDTDRVTDAIKHWEEKTKIKFVKRTDQKKYVTFRPGTGCSADVGMGDGETFVTLKDDCTVGNVKHEIGHTVGLFHEQSREDRDKHVKILKDNIQDGMSDQFEQHINDGDDIGDYDFGSIMHYPKNAFAKDDSKPTIVTIPPDQKIGQRDGLSAGDIAAVAKMYP